MATEVHLRYRRGAGVGPATGSWCFHFRKFVRKFVK